MTFILSKINISRFRLISIFALLFLLLYISACSPKHDNNAPDYILRLDELIDKKSDFETEKLIRLDDLRQKISKARSASDRFSLNSLIFDEFSTYASDSAVKYIDENISIANNEHNLEWLYKSYIKKADYYTSTGMLTSAHDLLKSIDTSILDPYSLADYYGQMIFLYSHFGNFLGEPNNEYYVKERAYKDSIMAIIPQDHPEYLWYKGLDILGTDKPTDEIINALKQSVDNSQQNTPIDAKNAFILGMLYHQIGNEKEYRRYVALSASADIRFCNQRELSSLEELSRILYDNGKGDISRAFNYVNYCLAQAVKYPNRVKIYGISEALGDINNEYQNRLVEQRKADHRTLVVICLLAAILAAAIVVNVFQYIRLHRQKVSLDISNKSLNDRIEELHASQSQLHLANEQLKQLNEDLKQKNYELDEANYVKEEYICNIFTICSNYIGKITDLKKSVHLNLIAKKYREIERETEDFDMRVELKDFYRAFDAIFLHIYPDFVKDFNSLLQEDKRIYPKDGELLNTELRIYALIRLGITDSVKIAEFLHCSPQTVYNNRFKVRNKAIIPKEDFADAVRRLGRYVAPGA